MSQFSNGLLDLREETPSVFSKTALSGDAALFLHKSGKFDIDWPSPANGFSYSIRPRGWIGHIPVADSDTFVRISPKTPVANIFQMLEVAYNLRSFQLLEGTVDLENLNDLFERLAAILARRILDRARKGLYRDYLNERDELSVVRGRIDVPKTMLRVAAAIPRLHCEFQHHTADLDENRILLWTLYILPRFGIKRSTVRRQVGEAFRALAGEIRLEEKEAGDCIRRFYHRLNDDYQPLHGLCRFFLEHAGPGIKTGEREFFPFMLNMPRLFEEFVASWLKPNAPENILVRSQHTAKLEANAELTFRIDIVLQDRYTGRPMAVLDTKYKASDYPLEADVQQVAAYALEMGVDRAFLVYPGTSAKNVMLKVGHVQIESVVFDIGKQPDVAGEEFLAALLGRPDGASSLSA